jgi:hypothetical protein
LVLVVLIDSASLTSWILRDFRCRWAHFGAGANPNHQGKYLQLQFTVEDKGASTTPWTATMTYGFGPADWMEQVCAENIQWYSGKDAEVPRANKPDF